MARVRKGLRRDDGIVRCWWCGEHEDYQRYHDEEWGRPEKREQRLFEKICLEGFQSGLSWLTILRKRDAFRRAFKDFDYEKVARFRTASVERLLQDASIVRHRGKIESTIHNAKCARELVQEFGSLATYFWGFEPTPGDRPKRMTHAALAKLAKTPASTAMSKDLRKRGWTYVGPTTCYAFMQSMGLVNDHLEGCHVRDEIESHRKRWKKP